MDHFTVVDHFSSLLLLGFDGRLMLSYFDSARRFGICFRLFLLGLGHFLLSLAQTFLALFVEPHPVNAELFLHLHAIDSRYR